MEQNETGFEASERPILCINDCGFFGSRATRNMCSKCHKEAILEDQRAKIAATSIDNIVNGSFIQSKDRVLDDGVTVNAELESLKTEESSEATKSSQSRCGCCNKRVGLTGFRCKCGNLYCANHRHFSKHDCPFDYRNAAQKAIAMANPVVKSEKLHKI